MSNLYEKFKECAGVATDTRKDLRDTLFFCLRGETFDGNEFAPLAIEKGAKYVVVDNKKFASLPQAILVEDTLNALQALAHEHRTQLATPLIALTGSNGKTTTKELIYSVLSQSFRALKTEGNLNNHIGVPLTLLRLTPDTDIAIVEMGANHPGEIAALCQIAEPDFGYITNFGRAHLEGFGSFEGVVKTKSELYNYLKKAGKRIFFCQDNELQADLLKDYSETYCFSLEGNEKAPLQLAIKERVPFVQLAWGETTIPTHLIGKYNALNAAAAICIGNYFKLSKEAISRGIEGYVPSNNRSQFVQKDRGNQILMDAYNANPTSMHAAIEAFGEIKAPHKVLILGDMKELGAYSQKEHQQLVDDIAAYSWDAVLLLGDNFYQTQTNFMKFKTLTEINDYLRQHPFSDTFFLIKGSRSMTMEKIEI